jgi:uncharacterized protein (TIGR02145 family)
MEATLPSTARPRRGRGAWLGRLVLSAAAGCVPSADLPPTCTTNTDCPEGTICNLADLRCYPPTTGAGRFADYLSPDVIVPPAEVGLDERYTRYLNRSGIPVIGSSEVAVEALQVAADTIDYLLEDADALHGQVVHRGGYYTLIGAGETMAELPEGPGAEAKNWVVMYVPTVPMAASFADNILCQPTNQSIGRSDLVLAWAWMVYDDFAILDDNFATDVQAAFDAAMAAGLWANTWVSNPSIYFVQGVLIWYGVNYEGPFGGEGQNNHVNTRDELAIYDPALYDLVGARFHDGTDFPGCLAPSFVDCGTSVDDFDGNSYEFVRIGNLCWTKENLRTAHFRDGTEVPNLTDSAAFFNDTSGAWVNVDHNPGTEAQYGKLYNWHAVSNAAGLCPFGWHYPPRREWQVLVAAAGGELSSAALRSATAWPGASVPSTDTTGFGAPPSGAYVGDASSMMFVGVGAEAHYWTGSEVDAGNATSIDLFNDDEWIYQTPNLKSRGFAARCVKD